MVDTDYGDWCEWSEDDEDNMIWREDRISTLLSEYQGTGLFVQGRVSNQGKFYDSFDEVVLLSAPVDTLLKRISTRTTNTFGKKPGERDRILTDLIAVEPLLRASATLEIDTRIPLPQVVGAVVGLTQLAR